MKLGVVTHLEQEGGKSHRDILPALCDLMILPPRGKLALGPLHRLLKLVTHLYRSL